MRFSLSIYLACYAKLTNYKQRQLEMLTNNVATMS